MQYQQFIPEGWEEEEYHYSVKEIEDAYRDGTVIQSKVVKCDDECNLHVDLGNGIQGTIPKEEVDLSIDEDNTNNHRICKNKVNQFVQFKVKSIENNSRYILSRKAVEDDALAWIKNELKEGMVVKGIVKNIRKFGAFIEIGGGIVALLHIEDISISRIRTPEERFKVGDKIDVMIKSIDRETGKVVLTYKQLLGDWDKNVEQFKEKTIVDGIVKDVNTNKDGIFIELMPNLVGLAEFKDGYEYGQKVKVLIKRIIKDKKKIKLVIV
jgi:small subunit ribosomal protein S1